MMASVQCHSMGAVGEDCIVCLAIDHCFGTTFLFIC